MTGADYESLTELKPNSSWTRIRKSKGSFLLSVSAVLSWIGMAIAMLLAFAPVAACGACSSIG